MFLKKPATNKENTFTCLSESEINHLQQKAKASPLTFSETIRLSSENMAGDMQSQIRGEGIDFEENKPYQAGSDSRHINWRQYAKTQQLYVNIYNEDKRPSTYLVFDQRPTMYFGTRKQLKIKLALKFAIYSLFLAANQQRSMSGVQIGLKPTWHTSYSSLNAILSFVNTLNSEHSFDMTSHTSAPSLNDILNKLNLTDGAELIIISDLHDMNDFTISSIYNLSRRYKVNIIQIQDPIEEKLPTKGQFNLQQDIDSEAIQLNCNNKTITNNYQRDVKKRFTDYKNKCQTMGVSFSQYATLDEFLV